MHRIRLVSIALLAAVLSSAPDVHPSESDRFPEAVRSDIERIREEWGIPGMAVGIIRDGEVILAEGC